MNNRSGIENQIKTRNDGNQAIVAQHKYDEDNTKTIEMNLNNLDMIEKSEKKVRQQKYKEMLDNQHKIRNGMKMYGNMTGMEKQMNKNDLSAFKNYDSNTYALIPGLNSVSLSPSKKVLNDKLNKTTIKDQAEVDRRMNQFGLTRDVTLIKNPAMYATNAHRSSAVDVTGHVNSSPATMRSQDPMHRSKSSLLNNSHSNN
jgi:hypothetical protein